MSSTWAVVVAALGASALTTVGTLGVAGWRARHQDETDRHNELRTACVELISAAQRLTHRAGVLHQTMLSRSGIQEGIDIALRHRKPIEVTELGEYLLRDISPMLEAQARIWVLGDEELIARASDVIQATGDVVSTATAMPAERQPAPEDAPLRERLATQSRNLRRLPRDPELEAAHAAATRELGRRCWLFGQAMRARMGTDDVEALFRAFPGFHEPSSHRPSPQGSPAPDTPEPAA